MKTPFIKVSENQRLIGYTKEGERLIERGHIFNFQNYNDIAVIEVVTSELETLIFFEVNADMSDITQITDEKTHFILNHLWSNADIINKINRHERQSRFLN